MNAALLPTELPRRVLLLRIFVAPLRIARRPAAYETAEVLFLQGAMIGILYHKKWIKANRKSPETTSTFYYLTKSYKEVLCH